MKTGDIAILAIAFAFAARPELACATAKIYDMTPLIHEPHPWQPVVPVAYRPRTAAVAPRHRGDVARRPTANREPGPAQPIASFTIRIAEPAVATPSTPMLRAVERLSAEMRPQTAESTGMTPQEGWSASPSAGGFYLSGSTGFGLLSDAANSGAAVDFETGHEVGLTVTGAIGYGFSNGIRAEFELSYRRFALDSLTLARVGALTGLPAGGFEAEGDAGALAFMADLAYDVPVTWRIVPHVMGGIGPALISLSDLRAGGAAIADDSDWVLAFQLGAGAGYPVSDRWLLGAEYRWFVTTAPSFEDAAGDAFDSEFSSHNFSLFARYAL